jgi:hypothetical protein
MNNRLMPRHEAWRQVYREGRYCRHLSQRELNQRVRDVFLNMMRVTPETKVGLPAMDATGIRWMELWTHVLEEMRLRHGPYPAGFTRDILYSEPLPDFAGELASKAAAVLSQRGLKQGDVFIKYGKPEHMAALLEHGAIRVQCASYYGTLDHNGAIRDDELSLPLSFSLTREDILKLVVNPQDVPGGPFDQRMDLSYRSDRDYWLYCVTTSVEPRLFVDFMATACVIIKDKERFRRLLRAQSAVSFPNTTYHDGRAVYIDPLLPSSARIFIPISKHFRYAYQEEFRFVWRPNTPVQRLSHVDLEVGPLASIAELVML